MRYSVINMKNPREIVLLRGRGCAWKQCAFCDYHKDFSPDEEANVLLNTGILSLVDGRYGRLEVINSGSFSDLDPHTMNALENLCVSRNIHTLHVECHWLHREAITGLRTRFEAVGVKVKCKTGVETFDIHMREHILRKGFGNRPPKDIALWFNECCLLFGLDGQTEASMEYDIQTGLKYFERVCINLMQANSTNILPNAAVRDIFVQRLLPRHADNPRLDILLENTDFGVGV